jgi:hypothetical protein
LGGAMTGGEGCSKDDKMGHLLSSMRGPKKMEFKKFRSKDNLFLHYDRIPLLLSRCLSLQNFTEELRFHLLQAYQR